MISELNEKVSGDWGEGFCSLRNRVWDLEKRGSGALGEGLWSLRIMVLEIEKKVLKLEKKGSVVFGE